MCAFLPVFLDSSPGLIYSSINAVVSSDYVLVVTSPDKSDVLGTRRMLRELYTIFRKKTGLILNKVPFEGDVDCLRTFDEYGVPLFGVVGCSCDLLCASGKCFIDCGRDDPFFEKRLLDISKKLEGLYFVDANASLDYFM